MPYVRRTKRRPSVSRRLKIVALVCTLAALVLVGAGLFLQQQERLANAQAEAAMFTPAPVGTSNTEAAEAVIVSIVSDSHAFNEDSWWRQTIVSGDVPGATAGAFESQPGATTTVLMERVGDAAEGADATVIQAGTNDLLSAASPGTVRDGVSDLAAQVLAAGAEPIIALVPPSDTHGQAVLELNAMLRELAEAESFPMLDVTSAVIAEDGTWQEGLSGDGVHANAEGSALMAEAAAEQFPAIIQSL